jgi:hypothetical protein
VTVNGFGAVRNFVVAGDAQLAATLYGTVSGPGGQALAGATVTVNDGNGQPVEDPPVRAEIVHQSERTRVTRLFLPEAHGHPQGAAETGRGRPATA